MFQPGQHVLLVDHPEWKGWECVVQNRTKQHLAARPAGDAPSYPLQDALPEPLAVDLKLLRRGKLPPPKAKQNLLLTGVPTSALEPIADGPPAASALERQLFGGRKTLYGPHRHPLVLKSSIPFKGKAGGKFVVGFEGLPGSEPNRAFSMSEGDFIVVFFDLEASGLSVENCFITEIAAVAHRFVDGAWAEDPFSGYTPAGGDQGWADVGTSRLPSFQSLVLPPSGSPPLEARVVALTGISNDLLRKEGIPLTEAEEAFLQWTASLRRLAPAGRLIISAHNGNRYDVPLWQISSLRACVSNLSDTRLLEPSWGRPRRPAPPLFEPTGALVGEEELFDDLNDTVLTRAGTGEGFMKRLGAEGLLDTLSLARAFESWIGLEGPEGEGAPHLIEKPSGHSLASLYRDVTKGGIPSHHRALADARAAAEVALSPTFTYGLKSDCPTVLHASSFVFEQIKLRKEKR